MQTGPFSTDVVVVNRCLRVVSTEERPLPSFHRCLARLERLARTGVQQIQATRAAFAAVLRTGRVVTWGCPQSGGDSRHWEAVGLGKGTRRVTRVHFLKRTAACDRVLRCLRLKVFKSCMVAMRALVFHVVAQVTSRIACATSSRSKPRPMPSLP